MHYNILLNKVNRSLLQWDVQPLTSGTYVSVSLSVTCYPHSLFVYFSRCHITSLSLTDRVSTCMLRSAPSVCQGKGDICWVKWTEASSNWFHLHFFWPHVFILVWAVTENKLRGLQSQLSVESLQLTCTVCTVSPLAMAQEEAGRFSNFRTGGLICPKI